MVLHTVGLKAARHRLATDDPAVTRYPCKTMGLGENGGLYVLRAGPVKGVRAIFVHGSPGRALGWSHYLMDPPPDTEVLALDRPGFGRSEPCRAAPTLAAQANAVAALLPQDGRPTVLVGHSLGGAVVAQVAAMYPARVHGLLLVASALDPALERPHRLQPWAARWPLSVMLPRALHHFNQELLAFKSELEQLAPQLPRIQAPTVLLHGMRDDLVPHVNVDYMRRHFNRVQQFTVISLPHHNHFLPWNAEFELRQALALATAQARSCLALTGRPMAGAQA